MYPVIIRNVWYLSYFGLFAISLIVAMVKANVFCGPPDANQNTKRGCCTRDPEWSFVSKAKLSDGVLFALGIMAILSAVLQAIIFLFMSVSIVTLYLLIAYNFANWGWPLSICTGRFFAEVQAFFVGIGALLMWSAAGYETILLITGHAEPDTVVSLPMLGALCVCSGIDFKLYVVNQWRRRKSQQGSTGTTAEELRANLKSPIIPQYTIDDDNEADGANEQDITITGNN